MHDLSLKKDWFELLDRWVIADTIDFIYITDQMWSGCSLFKGSIYHWDDKASHAFKTINSIHLQGFMLVSLEVIYQLKNRNGNQIQMRKKYQMSFHCYFILWIIDTASSNLKLPKCFLKAWLTLTTPLWRR